MPRHSYHERDFTFGQTMLTLRTSIGLTQASLAGLLGVSRRAVGEWELGLNYPKAQHLQPFLELCVQQHVFAPEREEEEIRALWKTAHQRVLLDESWLSALLIRTLAALAPFEEVESSAVVKASPEPVQLSPAAETPLAPADLEPAASPRVDWVGALDVSHFTGREVEVAELSQWIVQEQCRLVAILGMGGIGKSMLASYLGQHLTAHFEAVLWRSVRDAPSCEELVAECVTFFSETPPAAFPTSLEQRINQLVTRLQASRCLLVLDNLEALLVSGDPEGNYLPGYEDYGRLFGRLAESAHQSCVLLTSREKPREIEPLEGMRSPVRSLRLVGMDDQAAQDLLGDKGLGGTPLAWRRLVAGYAGNLLALKIVAQGVSDLFGGNIDRFLEEGELIFNGVRPLLRQQVGRLSALEHLLLTWLAVLREWTELNTLAQVLHRRVLRAQLLEALEALRRRSLLERGQQDSFSLQSVVMEFLTNTLCERLAEEIVLENPQQLRRVALEQAQAKDYVREIQVHLLVHPLLERLRSELGADAQVEVHLLRQLSQFRGEDAATQGYGPANVISLLKELRGHLRGLDLSRLAIRGAYLQGVDMQDATLAGAVMRECVLSEAFDAITAVAISRSGRDFAAIGRRGKCGCGVRKASFCTWSGWHTQGTACLAFSPNGSLLASASWDSTIWSQDDTQLASGGTDTVVTIWEVAGGRQRVVLRGHHRRVYGVAWSPDGSMLVSSGSDNDIRLWDPTLGSCLQIIGDAEASDTIFYGVAFSPGGQLLACGTFQRGVQVWDVVTRSLRWVNRAQATWFRRVAWSPDGTRVAGGGDDGSVSVWEATDGTLLLQLARHQGVVRSVAWSPDGRRLASGGSGRESGELFVWDAESGKPVHAFDGHPGVVSALSWVPDGEVVVSGGSDGRLRWWDLQRGECVRVREAHQGTVQALKMNPDGRRLASCGDDGAIRLWDIDSGEPLQTLRRDRLYERLNITDIRGLTESQQASLRALGAVEESSVGT